MMKRRITTGAIGLCLLTLIGCGGQSDASDDKITFVSYGGETQDAQIEALQNPFTKDTGIGFENDSPSDLAKTKAQVDSGSVSFDVVSNGGATVAQHCGELYEELSDDVVDWEAAFGDQAERVKSDCGVPQYYAPSILFYNTEDFPTDPPDSLEDVFDTEKYPGKRIFMPYVDTGILEIALMADGVAPEDLYPLDIERAFAKMDTIKDDSVFPSSY